MKASDQVQFFKGAQTRLCTMGTACLIWKIQRSSRQIARQHMLELKQKYFGLLNSDPKAKGESIRLSKYFLKNEFFTSL